MNTFIKSMALCALLAGSTALQASQAARDLKAAIQNKDKAKALSLVDAVREFYSTQPRNFARFAQDFRDQFGQSIQDAMDEIYALQSASASADDEFDIVAAATTVESNKKDAFDYLNTALNALNDDSNGEYDDSEDSLKLQKNFLDAYFKVKTLNAEEVEGSKEALDKIILLHSQSNGFKALEKIIDTLIRKDVQKKMSTGRAPASGLNADHMTLNELKLYFNKEYPLNEQTANQKNFKFAYTQDAFNDKKTLKKTLTDVFSGYAQLADLLLQGKNVDNYRAISDTNQIINYLKTHNLLVGDESLKNHLMTLLYNVISNTQKTLKENKSLERQIIDLKTQLAAAQAQPQAPAPAPAQQTQTQQPQPQAPAQPAQAPAQPAQAPAFDVNTASADDFMKEFKRITKKQDITPKDIMRNLGKLSSNLNQNGDTSLNELIKKGDTKNIKNFLDNSTATVNPTTDQLTAIRAALNMLLEALTNKSYTWN